MVAGQRCVCGMLRKRVIDRHLKRARMNMDGTDDLAKAQGKETDAQSAKRSLPVTPTPYDYQRQRDDVANSPLQRPRSPAGTKVSADFR